MGQKISPTGLRISIVKDWSSKWFSDQKKKYRSFLLSDIKIRDYLRDRLKKAMLSSVDITRHGEVVKIILHSSRPGVIIGRSGVGIEDLKRGVSKLLPKNIKVEMSIQEIKNPETEATLLAAQITEQIEKRIACVRAAKRVLEKAKEATGVLGIKVKVTGRLDGNEIARSEWFASGKLPLHTLRADIDFARAQAHTTYGVVGVKVWVYRGEVFK